MEESENFIIVRLTPGMECNNKCIYCQQSNNTKDSFCNNISKSYIEKYCQTILKLLQNRYNNLEDYYRKSLDNRIALSIIGLGLNIMSGKMSGRQKRKEIKSVIGSESYRNAYKQLTLKYFPIHWKVFFFCAKYKITIGVFILLKILQKIIQRGRD